MSSSDGEFPREHQRQRVLKAGLIIFDNLSSTVDVTLRDLSEGGAKLKLAQPMPLPDHFSLRIQNATTNQTETHLCEKRWQRADLVGVTFIVDGSRSDRPAEDPATAPAPRYRLLKANSTLFQNR
ncbi:conserved domain protein [Hyphomonas neptunium ATCC 15444]|uniref:Conserved domain protein n=2 Tax=Hyphomonas TaxID=85 RepID=Q0BXH6_HYPNA|nr:MULTISPECIES: PilZ domain-containing protein [Hyphomonas]ABI78464.1 conserved domain protein [Hyphomonas neptunium ATCC 15444]KCZ89926.1 hypothetical protein HHI_13980 [Hyphomonas hirschiana VP5]